MEAGGEYIVEDAALVRCRLNIQRVLSTLDESNPWVSLMKALLNSPSIELGVNQAGANAFEEFISKLESPYPTSCIEISKFLSLNYSLFLFFSEYSSITLENGTNLILSSLSPNQGVRNNSIDAMIILYPKSGRVFMFSRSYLLNASTHQPLTSCDTFHEPLGGSTQNTNNALQTLIGIREDLGERILNSSLQEIVNYGHTGIQIFPSAIYYLNGKIIIQVRVNEVDYFVITENHEYFELSKYSLYLGYLSLSEQMGSCSFDEPKTLVVYDNSTRRYFLYNNVQP